MTLARRLERRVVDWLGLTTEEFSADRIADYAVCFQRLASLADYVTVNVSSPNTPGLRGLQDRDDLHRLLQVLTGFRAEHARRTPLLLKIAPDLDEAQVVGRVAPQARSNYRVTEAKHEVSQNYGVSENVRETADVVAARQDNHPRINPVHLHTIPLMRRTLCGFRNRWNWNPLCLRLCKHRTGRLVLHMAVLLRSRKNLRWHLIGIRREVSFSNSNSATRHVGSDKGEAKES
jgi:hypothetical protein